MSVKLRLWVPVAVVAFVGALAYWWRDLLSCCVRTSVSRETDDFPDQLHDRTGPCGLDIVSAFGPKADASRIEMISSQFT